MNQPSFYAIIPANVRYCKQLEPSAKLLYGEITALATSQGFCWATNQYFAELYEVDTSTIQRWLKSLKDLNFIKVDVQVEGIQRTRKIWISGEVKEMFTKPQKCGDVPEKMRPRTRKNEACINTSSITSKDTPIVPQGEEPASRLADFLFQEIRKIKPDFSKKMGKPWIKDCESLLKIRSESDLHNLIKWVLNDPFWRTTVQAPSGILKHLDKLEMKMKAKPAAHRTQENKEIAEKIESIYPKEIQAGHSAIVRFVGQTQKEILYSDSGFKSQLQAWLRLMNKTVPDFLK